MHDAEHLLDAIAQRRAKADQKRAFGRRGLNLPGQPGAEDGVLGFQVCDLAQENRLRHVDEENQKRMLASGGRHGKRRGRKMVNRANFGYENLPAKKNPIYRGGAAAEQRFCTPHKCCRSAGGETNLGTKVDRSGLRGGA